jgi:N-acyl-D-aspartate/D-glutamate deacylase
VQRPEHAALVGKNVAALARAVGKDPLDWLLDFALDGELDAMFDCKLFNTDEDQVASSCAIRAQNTLSDAGRICPFCATRASDCISSDTGCASGAT